MDANDWDKRYEATESVWTNNPNQFVVEYLSPLAPGKMIDLAGGEGRNALWLADRGWVVENADFSSVAIKKYVDRAASLGLTDHCVGTVLDATDATPRFALSPVNLLLVAYLQIPHDELTAAMHSAIATVKPGGHVLGIWHARENLTDGYAGPQDPSVLPTIDELKDMVEDTRLDVRELALKDRFVEVDGETKRAIDVVLWGQVAG